jgi:hypothetical protein
LISETLTFLAAELNQYLDQKVPVAGASTRVKVGNIARASDAAPNPAVLDKIALTLVNIEEERSVRLQETVIKTATTSRLKYPPLLLNLYLLVASNREDYVAGLGLLGHVVQFFQFQSRFTPSTHPQLDRRIERLTVELYTLNFEQVNHLWSTLGGKYLPSMLYKVRQLTIDENAIISEGPLIEQVELGVQHLEASS